MAKKQPKKAAPAAKKAAKAAPKKLAKPKAARPKPVRPARKAVRPKPETLPGHHATKAEFIRHKAEADHAHEDPRWTAEKPDDKFLHSHTNPRLDQGAIKTRGIPRMNPMINWFRRAPKKKSE